MVAYLKLVHKLSSEGSTVVSNQVPSLSAELLGVLACPHDQTPLRAFASGLLCEHEHRFAIEQGVPVFSGNPRRERIPGNMEACQYQDKQRPIDQFVDDWLVNTNGNLYWKLRGKLPRYPIPKWPSHPGPGKLLLDIGCGWGRWTMAAARAGFKPIGLDVHLDALAAAGRVSQQMDIRADFVCADADSLPFQSGSVDMVFSYSVLQHLERSTVLRFLKEVARLLKPGGICLIQLPNTFGLYNMLLQLRRGFREARAGTFEMRYWSRAAIRKAAAEAGLGNLRIRADGFFTQNPQVSDLDLLSTGGKLVVLASQAGCKVAAILPVLSRLADSLWVEAGTQANSSYS